MRLFVLVWVLLTSASALAGKMQFRVPEGWTNLSPDAPASEIAKAPPQLVADVRAGGFAFYAADLAHAEDGFMENESVLIHRLSEPVTNDYVDGVVAEVEAGHKNRNTPEYRTIEKGLVSIAGANSGRVVSEFDANGTKVKQIAYLIPGGDSVALMTFTTTAAEFEHYASIFDAAARATLGVAQPPSRIARVLAGANNGAVIGGLAGGLVGLLYALARKKAKK